MVHTATEFLEQLFKIKFCITLFHSEIPNAVSKQGSKDNNLKIRFKNNIQFKPAVL